MSGRAAWGGFVASLFLHVGALAAFVFAAPTPSAHERNMNEPLFLEVLQLGEATLLASRPETTTQKKAAAPQAARAVYRAGAAVAELTAQTQAEIVVAPAVPPDAGALSSLQDAPAAAGAMEMQALEALRARVRQCWRAPLDLRGQGLEVALATSWTRKGFLRAEPRAVNTHGGRAFAAARRSALAALRDCEPLALPLAHALPDSVVLRFRFDEAE